MIVLGVTGYAGSLSHDAAAAIVENGRLIAASEEERHCGEKHSPSLSPIISIKNCLRIAGISITDVDAIASGWNVNKETISVIDESARGEWANNVLPFDMFPIDRIPKTYFVKHHLAHVSAGMSLSGLDSAVCLCLDGQGENESITIYEAHGSTLQCSRSYDCRFSLGALYEAASDYCGLGFNVPGKLMGLAAYGEPVFDIPLEFDSSNGVFSKCLPTLRDPGMNAFDVCAAYSQYFIQRVPPFRKGSHENVMEYADFAASVQDCLERNILSIGEFAAKISNQRRLVLTGGVALNCTANGRLEHSGLFDQIFIPPGPYDASCSIGSAMEVSRLSGHFGKWNQSQLMTSRLGMSYDHMTTQRSLSKTSYRVKELGTEELSRIVAYDLSRDKIVAWFKGRAEFGPRALGGRSLLADPRKKKNIVRVNALKGREMWRPLAPSVLIEEYSGIFEDDPSALSNFMLKAVSIKSKYRKLIPAVTHVDGTSRPHTVHKFVDPEFYELISSFRDLTGIPLVLNTSLNGNGQPIVETPEDALAFFQGATEIDVLVIDNFYVERNGENPRVI